MKKIGICTVYTGYNYGSALQAFATKSIVSEMGYVSDILKLKGSVLPGRDIRLSKMFLMFTRSLLLRTQYRKAVSAYISSYKKEYTKCSLNLFNSFYAKHIAPQFVRYSKLKRISRKDEYFAFICGSDQVWNSTALYIDPFYYLQFCPYQKRIAFAPSLGKEFIPDYNKKQILKKIDDIKFLSVREKNGKDIIENFLKRDCELLIDPTLVINKKNWIELLGLKKKSDDYCLAYFLDRPSDLAVKTINTYALNNRCRIISIPYSTSYIDGAECLDCGPIEFLDLVLNAKYVFTDSFHGTAFSINFEKNFVSFNREYGSAANQSSRLLSLLGLLGLENRFDLSDYTQIIDYSVVNELLKKERNKSLLYLKECFDEIDNE